MKRLCLITLTIVCLGVNRNTYAEIRNGYDKEMIKAEKWLGQLHEITNGSLNELESEKMNKKLKEAHAIIDKLRKNHAKTQDLIERLRMIDPGLYGEMNSIKDSEGNETDVYIKVVDRLRLGMLGATNVDQSVDNPSVYSSEHGDYTVSVWVVNTNPIRAMLILVHELGHVRYQVPHLADYIRFYMKSYQNKYLEGIKKGHHPDDPSAYSVQETLKNFKRCWREYNREMKWMVKDKSRKTLTSTRED